MSDRVAIIDTLALANGAQTLQGSTPISVFSRLLDGLPGQQSGMQVDWVVRGESDGRGRRFLELEIRTTVQLECQRCMTALAFPVDVRNRLEIVRSESDLEEDDDEQPERIVGSARFDLLALVQDEIILALPYVPRHDQCPGGSEAAPRDDDVPDARPSPFAVLGKLKKD